MNRLEEKKKGNLDVTHVNLSSIRLKIKIKNLKSKTEMGSFPIKDLLRLVALKTILVVFCVLGFKQQIFDFFF